MRMKRFMKHIVSASLAVLVAVTAIPFPSAVQAATDEFPPEIYFPIQVLDFRRDDLLFEWNNASQYNLGLFSNYYGLGNGKGLVEEKLGPDKTPVYKQSTVEEIARIVQKNLEGNFSSNLLNKKVGSEYHDLSLRKYVKANYDPRPSASILDWNTNQHLNPGDYDSIWKPEGLDPGVTYKMEMVPNSDYNKNRTYGDSTIKYKEVYAEVYEVDAAGNKLTPDTPVYIVRRDGLTFFKKVSVSKTFTGLSGSYTVNNSLWKGDNNYNNTGKTKIFINDTPVKKGSVVSADANGEIKVTIEIADSVTDPLHEAFEKLTVAYIVLDPDKGYPLGDYTQSKTKFDNDPSLGWTDITTCMDYAYFVTKNLFLYHPSLNTQYNDYENLIFHKVDSDGKVYYEFAAAEPSSKIPKYDIIYNKTDKTIRNAFGTDTGDTTKGDKITEGGSMFILDDLVSAYPEIDYKIWGTSVSGNNYHNFHYTIASHSKFVYKEGAQQTFYFSGDDDVYVFVNDYLYMDLGGAHTQLNGEINLDKIATEHPEWDIKNGKVVSLDFFYMERHSTESNFYGKMNFKLANDDVSFDMDYDSIPYGYLQDLNYNFTTLRELTTNKNITFTDELGNTIGANGFKLGEGVTLRDNKLKVTVVDENGNIDTTRTAEFTFVDPKNPTPTEVAAVSDYFKKLEVRQGEVVKVTGPQYDTSFKPYSKYDDVAGTTVNEKSLTFHTDVTYDAWMDGAQKATKGKEGKDRTVTVLTGSAQLCVAKTDNEKKQLADYGKFTIDRDGDYMLSEADDEVIYVREGDSPNAKYNYISNSKDKPGAYHYENNPDVIGVTDVSLDQLPMGNYTIKLDPTVLTSYKLFINDEEVPQTGYDSTKEKEVGVIWINEAGVPELTLKYIPEYDWEAKQWTYPDLKFELRAKRIAPDLKDLT
ncbi:MAG: fibro-slime domain-containing protein [Clostridiales bacterium]|nr:fibro-slime domain-containing protein [Clostridiales bacterium]